MPRSAIRRLVALAAPLVLALVFPLAASATITGGCTGTGTATSSSVDLVTATEWHVKKADVGGGSGTGPPAKAGSVGAKAFGLTIPIASGTDPEGKTEGSVDGVSVSMFALLGHRFIVAGSADNGCAGQIEIIIDDQDPALTLLGGGGAAIGVIFGLLVLRTMRGGKGFFKRLLDLVYGVIGGAGAALSLEQFGVLDPDSFLGLGLIIAAGLFGWLTCGILGGGKKKEPPAPTPAPAPPPPPPPVPTTTPDPGPLPDPGGDDPHSHMADDYPGSERPVGGGGPM